MKSENFKIEICEMPDRMDLDTPVWSVYDSESGEYFDSISDEMAIHCMHMMMYCAMKIKSALEYKKTLQLSIDNSNINSMGANQK